MRILIKGMEMPKRCRECRFDSAGWCFATDRIDNRTRFVKFATYDSPQEWCPLVPVPPHGRLIDADVVFKRLQKQAMSVWGNGNPRYQIVLEVMDAIRFAPTIIEAEEGE